MPKAVSASVGLQQLMCTSKRSFPQRDIVAELCVDSHSFSAVLQLDLEEHADRQHRGLGAVDATGLLHALWTLPHGIGFPRSVIDPLDLRTLAEQGTPWVEDDCGSIRRRYRPIGTVDLVAVAHSSLSRAVSRVAEHPPSFRRLAIWLTDSSPIRTGTGHAFESAANRGIGIAAVGDWGCALLLEPAARVTGRPAVYRWWLAEIAYRNWLRQTAPTG
jgi:hypothetical protein